MKTADFRIQTTAPDAPGSSAVVTAYADASGILILKDSDSNLFQVGANYTGSVPTSSVPTGRALNTGQIVYASAVGSLVSGLGTPTVWLKAEYQGNTYAVPAYLAS